GVYRALLWSGAPQTMNSEQVIFPGFLPVMLIAAWAVRRRRPSASRLGAATADAAVACVLILLVSYILSLGPWLIRDHRDTLRLPAYCLAAHVPGFSGIRAWSRFGIGVVLALAVLVGIALTQLTERASPATRALVASAVIGILAVEYYAAPLTLYAV